MMQSKAAQYVDNGRRNFRDMIELEPAKHYSLHKVGLRSALLCSSTIVHSTVLYRCQRSSYITTFSCSPAHLFSSLRSAYD